MGCGRSSSSTPPLVADERRNALILDDVIRSLEEGHSPIVLTERKDHLDYLASRLEGFTRHLVAAGTGRTPARAESGSSTMSIATCRCCCGCSRGGLRGYRAIGYASGDASLGFTTRAVGAVVEYDEDMLPAVDDADNLASQDRGAGVRTPRLV